MSFYIAVEERDWHLEKRRAISRNRNAYRSQCKEADSAIYQARIMIKRNDIEVVKAVDYEGESEPPCGGKS